MKDIDFDELDRAVGSVLGSDAAVQTDSQADAPAVTTVAKPDSRPSSHTNNDAISSPEKASMVTTETVPTATVSPAISPARKRGQFLDMVHPSADMTKTPKMPLSPRKTVTPLNSAVVADTPKLRSADEATHTSPVETTAPDTDITTDHVPDVDENTTDNNTEAWPDPLDFAKESAEAAAVSQETQPSTASPDNEPINEQASEPAQTPFVADAKVDKRPLGAFATQEDEMAGQTPAELTPAPEDTPEFNPEVNSVEATGVPQAEDEATGLTGETPKDEDLSTEGHAEVLETQTAEPTPTSEETKPEVFAAPEEPKEPAKPVAASAPIAGAQSIPQQYKTAESHGEDDERHPLFDTEEYHQPLLTDGKKKSKKIVLIIVMLVILLILGGALGYIAYTMGI